VRSSRFDLTLEAAIDRVRGRNHGLIEGSDCGHRFSPLGDNKVFAPLRLGEEYGRFRFSAAHAYLKLVSHVATNVATEFRLVKFRHGARAIKATNRCVLALVKRVPAAGEFTISVWGVGMRISLASGLDLENRPIPLTSIKVLPPTHRSCTWPPFRAASLIFGCTNPHASIIRNTVLAALGG
jgi:hypothetical protein